MLRIKILCLVLMVIASCGKTDYNLYLNIVKSERLAAQLPPYCFQAILQARHKNLTKLKNLEPEYFKLASERGAIIEEIIKIERNEESHFIFEDADFSKSTIKQLINQGQKDAEKVLKNKKLIKI